MIGEEIKEQRDKIQKLGEENTRLSKQVGDLAERLEETEELVQNIAGVAVYGSTLSKIVEEKLPKQKVEEMGDELQQQINEEGSEMEKVSLKKLLKE